MKITETLSIVRKEVDDDIKYNLTKTFKDNKQYQWNIDKSTVNDFSAIGILYDRCFEIPKTEREKLYQNFNAAIGITPEGILIKSLLSRIESPDGFGKTQEQYDEYLASLKQENAVSPNEMTDEQKKTRVKEAIQNMINFFSEWSIEPNYRFINTVSRILSALEDKEKATCNAFAYINNYFSLTDNLYASEIARKLDCKEFKAILSDLMLIPPTKKVNDRLKIYYGSAGCGKTTLAQQETDGLCIICNSSILPNDLMKDFDFREGKPTFKKSVLWTCMEEGKPVTLDEINLLPYETLRFLQGLLDGKKEFEFEGNRVEIKDGFKIIGTMNLQVNGNTFGLPEPLVDRCEEIRSFKLTADELMGAIL